MAPTFDCQEHLVGYPRRCHDCFTPRSNHSRSCHSSTNPAPTSPSPPRPLLGPSSTLSRSIDGRCRCLRPCWRWRGTFFLLHFRGRLQCLAIHQGLRIGQGSSCEFIFDDGHSMLVRQDLSFNLNFSFGEAPFEWMAFCVSSPTGRFNARPMIAGGDLDQVCDDYVVLEEVERRRVRAAAGA